MGGYILRRLLWAIPTLWGAVTLLFLIMRVLPGDVAMVMLGSEGAAINPEQLHALREQLGLNRPLWEQYLTWMIGFSHLDLGKSLWTGNPVWSEIAIRVPYTFTLIVMAMILSLIIAIPTGVFSALKQDSWLDYGLRSFAIAGLSIPNFWFGLLLLLLTVSVFKWSPPIEYATVFSSPLVASQQLLLPALALGWRQSAVSARMMRSSMLEVMREDYVRTARSKGLRERTVIIVHAMRNAILPVITIFGTEILLLISGAVIIETIFNIPGIGRLLVDGINHRDVNLVQGLVAFITIIVLLINLLVDLIYGWVDPRIRYE
ncbi:MAG: ABC transporter permease [Dehalococcoidia bacterium]|nr:ABC transporter permease [Dehalococcoidia bacterium]